MNQDARLREVEFLARLDREKTIRVPPASDGGPSDRSPERQMIASLIYDGYVNGVDSMFGVQPGMFWQSYNDRRATDIFWVLGTGNVSLTIGHKGRVRLSELRQQLKAGRDRDPTGLCLARRHFMADLVSALTETSTTAPLSVVFLDMNGLKSINDTYNHRAGDDAIRAYLEAVVATFGERGEAYRGEGGDEALVILPSTLDDGAGKLLDTFVRQLGKDALTLGAAPWRLTASCGSASTADPNEDAQAFLDRANAAEKRAKVESKKHDPRVSALAVGSGDVVTYTPGFSGR